MDSTACKVVGCSDQCLFAGAVIVNEVQNASSATLRKSFGPRDDALNKALNSLNRLTRV